MKLLSNLKLGPRLGVAFSALLLVMVVVGMSGYLATARINKNLDAIFLVRLPSLDYLIEADRDVQQLLVAERSMIFADVNSAEFKRFLSDYEENLQQSEERWNAYKALATTDEEKAVIAAYERDRRDWMRTSSRVVEARKEDTREGRRLAIDLTLGQANAQFEKMREHLNTLQELSLKMAKEEHAASRSAFAAMRIRLLAIMAVAVGGGLLLALVIARGITDPTNRALKVLRAMSSGDLRENVTVTGRDEIATMLEAMATMTAKLRGVVSDVKRASDNLASGSQSLSSTAQQLSQGTAEQASTIEEVSSSMEEMVANIEQNAENARHTEQIAVKVAIDAREGGEAVARTLKAMKDIAAKISIVEEIARQTNLLALNAAIEAARAGEQGKGFAVVAAEVKKLAQRSQEAAAEISERSTSSVEVAEKAGEMLLQIVPEIQKTAELVKEIAAASSEQKMGTSHVSKAVEQIDQVIQQNASTSEELAATSEELTAQADALKELMAFFQVGQFSPETAWNGSERDRPRNSPAPAPVAPRLPLNQRAYAARIASQPDNGDAPEPSPGPDYVRF
jgi:methyl-accepting chemotaxis protein